MKIVRLVLVLIFAMVLSGCVHVNKHDHGQNAAHPSSPAVEKLGVVWTSGDPDVAHKVCFMYTHNAKKAGWFDEVELIVWGPSSKLLSEDKSLQDKVKTMLADGVKVTACKACADSYGVSDDLTALGIDVKYMGKPLTEMLQTGWRVITF